MRRHSQRDPVTPETYAAVWLRDQSCVAPRIDAKAGRCMNRWGGPARSQRDHELDHVRPAPAMGKRGPSVPSAMILLCHWHHQGGWATRNRNLERQYLRTCQERAAA